MSSSGSKVVADLLPQVDVRVDKQTLEVQVSAPPQLRTNVAAQSLVNHLPGDTLDVSTGDEAEACLELSVITTSVGVQGPAGASGTGQEAVHVPGFDTSLVTPRRIVYTSGDYQAGHASAEALPGARALGLFDGQLGKVMVVGVGEVLFTGVSPTPTLGSAVFLSRADAETGAEGKVSAAPAFPGFVAPVGIVVSVPANFSTTRVASVKIHIQTMTHRT